MALSRLYFITVEDDPVGQIGEACAVGVRLIQLRLKEAPDQEFLAIAKEAMKICRRWGSKLIINDRVAVAASADADGVHVGKEDLPVREARRLLGKNKIVGGTANTLEDIREHCKGGADYIGLGPYRYTTTKKKLSPILGLEGYARIMAAARLEGISVPLFAIGGIGTADVGPLLRAGVYGVAFSGVLAGSTDKASVVRRLESEIQKTI